MVINIEKIRRKFNEIYKETEGSGYTEWRECVKKEFNNTTLVQKKDYLRYIQSRVFFLEKRKNDVGDFINYIMTMVVVFFSTFFSIMYGFYDKSTDVLTAYANNEKLPETSYVSAVDFYGKNINRLVIIMMATLVVFVSYRLGVYCIDYFLEKDRLSKIEFYMELEEIVKEVLTEKPE